MLRVGGDSDERTLLLCMTSFLRPLASKGFTQPTSTSLPRRGGHGVKVRPQGNECTQVREESFAYVTDVRDVNVYARYCRGVSTIKTRGTGGWTYD
ncbi:hypothetical protein PAXRUDRAFT_836358 [Paxillus rubicundulus Ve08.2h10]|uniref:Uncharacterized protein n=1 Tax=Paxillus rubicundulus Ve08.2h10 TaxID=930991 RepID=A0A0D0CBN8_9AGAM|nr:hypothetical protein PAXRUDRAFT_836358 [Paxillus rubicundulus Ve08.2h10]